MHDEGNQEQGWIKTMQIQVPRLKDLQNCQNIEANYQCFSPQPLFTGKVDDAILQQNFNSTTDMNIIQGVLSKKYTQDAEAMRRLQEGDKSDIRKQQTEIERPKGIQEFSPIVNDGMTSLVMNPQTALNHNTIQKKNNNIYSDFQSSHHRQKSTPFQMISLKRTALN